MKKHLYLAPMMKKTDRHFRFLVRLISPNTHLFTEMLPAEMIIRSMREKALAFSDVEKPVAIQLGGSNPEILAKATQISANWGYGEINLNCGCPSKQVINGNFGAYLMKDPKLAVSCVKAMRLAAPSSVSISAKIRLGVDDLYSYDYLRDFVGKLKQAGASIIHVHARKAMIKLSPKSNRAVPPINYLWVYKLKQDHADAVITVNGEINTISSAMKHLSALDGIMIGRHAYSQPFDLINFDRSIFPESLAPKRNICEILEKYLRYTEIQLEAGVPIRKILQPILNLYRDRPYAKLWRQLVTQQISSKNIDLQQLQAKASNLIVASL